MERQRTLMCATLVGFAMLAACTTVGPDYERPESAMPDAWHTAAVDGLSTGEADLQTWWRTSRSAL